MKFVHFDLDTVFDVVPETVNVLVVEPEDLFFRYCRELAEQMNGNPGNYCLSEGETVLPLSKAAVLVKDYLALNVGEKKFSAKLYRSLQEIAERHFLREYQKITELLADFFVKLNAESDCPITYDNDGGISALLKSFDVHIADDDDTLLERLLLFIHANVMFFNTRCFFFINLKTVLSEDSLLKLYHELKLREICIFLLENTQKPKLSGEQHIIIDRDLCEILA